MYWAIQWNLGSPDSWLMLESPTWGDEITEDIRNHISDH